MGMKSTTRVRSRSKPFPSTRRIQNCLKEYICIREKEREREKVRMKRRRRLQIFSARNVTRNTHKSTKNNRTWVPPKPTLRSFFLLLRFLSSRVGVVCPCFVYLLLRGDEGKCLSFRRHFSPLREKIKSCARFLQRVALIAIERIRLRKNSKEYKEEGRAFFEPRRRRKKKK